VTEATKPIVGRVRRPSWRDPRLLVGVLLIAVAVVAVTSVVRGADTTTPYFAAARVLPPGTVLQRDDLTVVHAHLTGVAYLPADAVPWGQVVTRTVAAGELLPASALVTEGGFDGRPVGVRTSVPVAATITAGSVVDVYVTEVSDRDVHTRMVGSGLVVDTVVRDQARMGLAGSETVYVVVPADQITAFLDALAANGDVSVVGYAGQGAQ